jgi:thiol-disulfide isomerase/thioredoxin
VLGTWCPDSRREVPRFMRILDSLEYPKEQLKIICVDRKKQALNNETDSLNIVYVPTIIFYTKEGVEVGRIIEHPKGETLEEDLEAILLALKPEE